MVSKYKFLDDVAQIMRTLIVPDSARGAQDIIARIFKEMGCKVIPEYRVRDRGDGYNGYVDLVVYADGLKVGVEIDNVSPREKSIYKLVENEFDVRIILLRNGRASQLRVLDGIDLVYCLSTG